VVRCEIHPGLSWAESAAQCTSPSLTGFARVNLGLSATIICRIGILYNGFLIVQFTRRRFSFDRKRFKVPPQIHKGRVWFTAKG
jgi:hypothetical protein